MKNIKKLNENLSFNQFEKELDNANSLLVRLPNYSSSQLEFSKKSFKISKINEICKFVKKISCLKSIKKTLIFYGPLYLLPYVYHSIHSKYHFKNLIAIRLQKTHKTNFLPNETMGLIIFSTYLQSLNTVKKPYEYCKGCGDTLKDYGGKKHLLENDGTRISDVWTDLSINKEIDFPEKIVSRIYYMTTKTPQKLILYKFNLSKIKNWKNENLETKTLQKIIPKTHKSKSIHVQKISNKIFNNDVFDGFKKIADCSIDLALIDPPYNIEIPYGKYSDNLDDEEYMEWCKKWIDQISRTLKQGGLLTLVNIPKWSLELFTYLQQKLKFQGWIVWDSFSYPHTPVIPAHYPILCFSKGKKLKCKFETKSKINPSTVDLLNPLNFGYCIRSKCIKKRTSKMKNDRKILSDLWTEIHRVRHNSFRYNHPTLMPQKLAKRIILSFTKKNYVILDCFNGVGTTTLVAQELNRKFIGIEKSKNFYKTSIERHKSLTHGQNPFERKLSTSTSMDKGYREIKPRKYVQKRLLQTEVKQVAKMLGHIPTKSELKTHGKYPIKYYFDNFKDWAEITVAARRSGI